MKALLRFTSILLVLVLLMPVYLSSSAASNTAVEFFPTTKEMKGWQKQIFDTHGWIWAPISNERYLSMLSHSVDSRSALTMNHFTADITASIEYTYVGKDLIVDLKKRHTCSLILRHMVIYGRLHLSSEKPGIISPIKALH